MKSIKKLMVVLISATIILSLNSCARKVNFLNSTTIPSAEGSVKVTKSSNDNYKIKVDVSHFADPGKLHPPKEVYVVWMETDNGRTANLGRIKSKSGLFSKNLKASLESNSPFYPVKIFITAEDKSDIQYPQGQEVLSTENF